MIVKHPAKSGKRTIQNCPICTKEFSALNIRIRVGRDKYCTRKCYIKSRSSLEDKTIRQRRYKRKCLYNLSQDDYDKLYLKQNGLCYICDIKLNIKNEAIDHNHITNIVRGLLCKNCNSGIGMFKENINSLKKAISYLENMPL